MFLRSNELFYIWGCDVSLCDLYEGMLWIKTAMVHGRYNKGVYTFVEAKERIVYRGHLR